MDDRESRTGYWVSGVAHTALILWAIVGGALFRPQPSPPVRSTQVSTISGADFEKLAAAARGNGPVGSEASAIADQSDQQVDANGTARPVDAQPPRPAGATQLAQPDQAETVPDLSDFEAAEPVEVATDLPTTDTQDRPEAEARIPAAPAAPAPSAQPSRPVAAAPDAAAAPTEEPRSALALDTSPRPQDRPAGLEQNYNRRQAAAAEATRAAAAQAAENRAAEERAAATRAANAAAAEEAARNAAREQATADAAEAAARAEAEAAEQRRAAEAADRAVQERQAAEAAERAAEELRAAQAAEQQAEDRRAAEAAERAAEEQRAAEAADRAAEERRAAEAAERAAQERQAAEAAEREAEERRAAEAAEQEAEERRAAEAAERAAEERQAAEAAERAAEERRAAEAAERAAEERRTAEREAEERRAAAEAEAAERAEADRQALEDALRQAQEGQGGGSGQEAASTGDAFGGDRQSIEGGSGASAGLDPLAAALAGAMAGNGEGAGAGENNFSGPPRDLMQLVPSHDSSRSPRDSGQNGAEAMPMGQPMSFSEREGLRFAIQNCWNVGALSVEASRMTVSVGFSLTPQGVPEQNSFRIVDFDGGSDAGAQQAYDVARRAILMCGGSGFDLPASKYGRWRDVVVKFRPDGIEF
ncbi:hypothetical protein [Paracoccus sp. JM45]|uniref:hypothetical protein n=1 Tax=Paracoccus sp. JM45 TaxID=2283626 RepID=UPI000E6D3A34|nr:hypothetical protein [Paracoccus sp. JM45]RJE80636.1 hypothetical protein DWB67_07195 [Paracoccus sp. JM45]